MTAFHFCYSVFISVVLLLTFVKSEDADSCKISTTEDENKKSLAIFQTVYKRKRVDQVEAIKRLSKLKYEEKYKLVSMMLNHTFMIASSNRVKVENSDYIPGSFLPANMTVREALYHLMEDIALYAELQLRLPDITDLIMNKYYEWQVLVKWTIGFTNSTGLFDNKTMALINLVAQDINLIERSPNFINPYRVDVRVRHVPPKEKKKKLKTPRTPVRTNLKPLRTEL